MSKYIITIEHEVRGEETHTFRNKNEVIDFLIGQLSSWHMNGSAQYEMEVVA